VSERTRRPAGFTLIEIMLAVGILGLILAMLAGAFSVVAHSKTHGESRMESDQAGRAIVFQMTKELAGAVQSSIVPAHVLLVGTGRTRNAMAIDGLTLSTLGAGHRRAVFGPAAEDIVTYTSRPNPDRRGCFLLLRNQQSALLPPGQGPQPQPVVMADNVLALHLRYYDGTRWNESWDSQAQGGAALPFAVSIDLQLASPSGQPIRFATQVPVPIAMSQK
jgi:prepilin-type N-terminal cleavage/methylation domain-containing protein